MLFPFVWLNHYLFWILHPELDQLLLCKSSTIQFLHLLLLQYMFSHVNYAGHSLSLLSCSCLLVSTIQINIAFAFPFQLQVKKTDCIKAAEASIKVLLDNPMKETAELIKEVQTKYDGVYSQLYLSTLYFQFLSQFLLKSQFQVLLIPNNSNFSFASQCQVAQPAVPHGKRCGHHP